MEVTYLIIIALVTYILGAITKDVISCEKLGGVAHKRRTRDIRMGEPVYLEDIHERGKSAN